MVAPSRAQVLFGTDEPVTPTRLLRAGPMTVELDGGNLRYLRFAGREAIRAISFVVRDENWGTYSAEITQLTVTETPEAFAVTYQGRCRGRDQELIYTVDIKGHVAGPDGPGLTFTATMTPVTRFRTNRAGFVVLHPLVGVVGQPVQVLHTDGQTEDATFPDVIDPIQCFKDIRALTHQVSPGVNVTCRMEGDVFEMEDQRNWGDASFKTYVRPLALPFPYELAPGTPVKQSIAVKFTVESERHLDQGGAAVAAVDPITTGGGDRSQAVAVRLDGREYGFMPAIGVAVRPEDLDDTDRAITAMADLKTSFLLCHLDLSRGHGARELQRYAALSRKTGVPVALEMALACTALPADELTAVAALAHQSDLEPVAITVSPAADMMSTNPGAGGPALPPLDEIFRAARVAFPKARLGGGTLAFFTELNRKPPPTTPLDFISHTTCSIIHSADDRSVMETLECLPSMLQSGRRLAGRAAYRLGPVAIGMRHNPYGAAPADNPENRRIAAARIDPRQRALFGAAFSLGYAARALRGGVEALTLGGVTGPFGLFDVTAGRAVPTYPVVAGLAAAAGCPAVTADSEAPSQVQALAFQQSGRTHVWMANLTSHPVDVVFSGAASNKTGAGAWSVMDEHNVGDVLAIPGGFASRAVQCPGGPLSLGAYAVACVRLPA